MILGSWTYVCITTPHCKLHIRPGIEVALFLLLSALGRSIVLSKVVDGNLFPDSRYRVCGSSALKIFVGHSNGISRANGIPDSILDYFVRSEVPVAMDNLLYTCSLPVEYN